MSEQNIGEIDASTYLTRIAAMPEARTERSVLYDDALLIAREGTLSMFYAPVDAFRPQARVVFVGLTPGWQQMRLALDAYRAARGRGRPNDEAQEAAKAMASFAGMRDRIIGWLDSVGVATWLGTLSTWSLFDNIDLLHTTSLIRYPVFVGPALNNYRGNRPRPEDSPLLRRLIKTLLIPELAALPEALVVPMGTAVSRALRAMEAVDSRRCLYGFPHPSGANGWATRQFAANRGRLASQVSAMQSGQLTSSS